jgi:hypothetical protein
MFLVKYILKQKIYILDLVSNMCSQSKYAGLSAIWIFPQIYFYLSNFSPSNNFYIY